MTYDPPAKTVTEAHDLSLAGVHLVMVGVGSNVNVSELAGLASAPGLTFPSVQDFSVDSIQDMQGTQDCTAPAQQGEGSTVYFLSDVRFGPKEVDNFFL